MLTRNQKSKMVYDVKELKEYFDKRFNELKKSLDVNKNTPGNSQSEIKSDLQKLVYKIDNKINTLDSEKKLLQEQITALAQQKKESQQPYDELQQCSNKLYLRIGSVPKQNNKKAEDILKFLKGLIEEVPDLAIPEVVIDRPKELVLIISTKKCRKYVSLSLFTLPRSVIVQHFTEIEGL